MRFRWLLLLVVLVLAGSCAAADVTTANESLYFNFSEGSGTSIVDGWGLGTGTFNTGVGVWSSTVPSYNLSGTGAPYSYDSDTGDYAEQGTVPLWPLGDYTINFWMRKSGDPASQQMFLGIQSGITDRLYVALQNSPAGSIRVADERDDVFTAFDTVDANIGDNAWHMVTVTAERGGNLTVYVDAQHIAIQSVIVGDPNAIGTTNHDYGSSMAFGAFNDRGSVVSGYVGLLDEVKIYDAVASQEQINALFNCNKLVCAGVPSAKFKLTAEDLFNGSSISEFWAYIDGVNYTTSNGSITTDLYHNDSSMYALRAGAEDYFSRNLGSIAVSSDYVVELFQSVVSFSLFEYISNASILADANFTIDATTAETFYLPAGGHVVLVDASGYYPQNFSFNVSVLFNGSIELEGLYNVLLSLNLTDVLTGETIVVDSFVDVEGLSYSFSTFLNESRGAFEIPLIAGLYNLTMWASDYAVKYVVVNVSNKSEYRQFALYANNSLWVYARAAADNSPLINFSVQLYNDNESFLSEDNGSGVVRFNDVPSGVYTALVSRDGFTPSVYAVTMTGGSHQNLTAYLVAASSESTIFTIIDLITNGIIEGATLSMFQTIGGVWTLILSDESDITGRVQVNYIDDVEYRFVVSAPGYVEKVFLLEPLFSSYTVRLEPDVDTSPDYATGDYVVLINRSVFYDGVNNSVSFAVSSGEGTLEYYNVTVFNFNGSEFFASCVNAYGCVDSFVLEIVGASPGDEVVFEYYIKESGKEVKFFRRVFLVEGYSADISTFLSWKDAPEGDGFGSLEKVGFASLLTLLVVGCVAVIARALGAPPLSASAVVLAFMFAGFGAVRFIPRPVAWLVVLGCLLVVVFARGEV